MTEPDVEMRKIVIDTGDVQVREIELKLGQAIEPHVHNCPVIGYVLSGTLLLQVGKNEPEEIHAGSRFEEPKGVVIEQFSNPSKTETVRFVACFLLNGEPPSMEKAPPARARIGFSKT
jgi:quercetin dioxygenase-like cupin family protein